MNLVTRQALDELYAIFAKARKGEIDQSIFRMTFFNLRQHVLGRKAEQKLSLEETAVQAVALVRLHFPNFVPRFAE